jgi:hypothetical protein
VDSVRLRLYGTTLGREVGDRLPVAGALGGQPVQVVLSRRVGAPDSYGLALVTTDLAVSPQEIIERDADRWSEETTFLDARHLVGVGQVRTRPKRSVERVVPFGLPSRLPTCSPRCAVLSCTPNISTVTSTSTSSTYSQTPAYQFDPATYRNLETRGHEV